MSESASFNKAGGSLARSGFGFVGCAFCKCLRQQEPLRRRTGNLSTPATANNTTGKSYAPQKCLFSPASTCTSSASLSFRRKCRANSSLLGPRCEVCRLSMDNAAILHPIELVVEGQLGYLQFVHVDDVAATLKWHRREIPLPLPHTPRARAYVSDSLRADARLADGIPAFGSGLGSVSVVSCWVFLL